MTDSFLENSNYFLTHILPWILVALAIILLSALAYHCRKSGECNPNTREEEYTRSEDFQSIYGGNNHGNIL